MRNRRLKWITIGIVVFGIGIFRLHATRQAGMKEAFGEAIAAGDIPAMLAWIEQGTDLETRDMTGRTALTAAVNKGDEALVDLLLERGADVNSMDLSGLTPLHVAARSKNTILLEMLLGNGADPQRRGWRGMTPLQVAVHERNLAAVSMLLGSGADPNQVDDRGTTALHTAADLDDLKIVQVLITRGAKVDARDHDGASALLMAVRGHPVRHWLGAPLPATEPTVWPGIGAPTLRAVPTAPEASQSHRVVQALLAAGADPQIRDRNGESLLTLAAARYDARSARILLNRGLRWGTTPEGEGASPSNSSGTRGVAPSVHRERTPLMHAAWMGDLAVVRAELARGARVNFRDSAGETALSLAVWHRHPEVVKALVAAGANVETYDHAGRTPLIVAGWRGMPHAVSVAMTRTLLAAGANPNRHDQFGATALMGAAYRGRVEVARLLLDRGADANARDKSGKTALWWADHLARVTRRPSPLGDLLQRAGARKTSEVAPSLQEVVRSYPFARPTG